MAWEERYGAIWNLPLRSGESVLAESYLSDRDLVTLVIKRADGRLSVSVLSKGNDPQWRLPFWSASNAPAIVGTLADADKYIAAMLGDD